MKNYKYHTVRIVPQSNREMKKKKSPHCQNISKISIKKSQNDAKLIPLSRNYMTSHLPDLVQIVTGTSKKVQGLNYFYGL
jgi:hypothetical protein